MKVCVLGLWHLGSVTAGCLANRGHDVTGLDFDEGVISDLVAGNPPIFEPGLQDRVRQGIDCEKLRFTTDVANAVAAADVIWVTYDTPVDDDDVADVDYVVERIVRTFGSIKDGAAVVVSSQLPVGSTRVLEAIWAEQADGRTCHFSCSPENLRLGKALTVFEEPDRIVVGVRDAAGRAALEPLFMSISERIEWMSVEAAEMTKHAINAFLATSITFANELAAICELTGADAREVARGLKSESRIGPGAYLSPGSPFAGGTLARDINFLANVSSEGALTLPVLSAVKPSNDHHRLWAARMLQMSIGDLAGKTIAILGLTYKAGTDTLRRSSAIELARWLVAAGASVRGYDPDLSRIPSAERNLLTLCACVEAAVLNADAVVLSTVKPALLALDWNALFGTLRRPVVVDAGGALWNWAQSVPGIDYAAVGFRTSRRGER